MSKRAREPRQVLDEDEYVLRLSRIVRRDFFPDAPPLALPGAAALRADADLGLDQFQSRFTTASAASFEELQRRAVALRCRRARGAEDRPPCHMLTGPAGPRTPRESKRRRSGVRAEATRLERAAAAGSSAASEVSTVCTEVSSDAGEDVEERYAGYKLVGARQRGFAFAADDARRHLSHDLGACATASIAARKRQEPRRARTPTRPGRGRLPTRAVLSPAAARLAARLLGDG